MFAPNLPSWERQGIGPDTESIISVAAVGLVSEVWRNSPSGESMHAGGGMWGKEPKDPEMFAESTALHELAVQALQFAEMMAEAGTGQTSSDSPFRRRLSSILNFVSLR